MAGLAVPRAYEANKVLPPGYSLDHDPDVAVLRRPDNSVVAYFPVRAFRPVLALEEAKADLLAPGGCGWEG